MQSVPVPFCGESYSDKTLFANAQDSINLYPIKTMDAKYSDKKLPEQYRFQRIVMYPTPGYKWQKYLGSGPVRGFYVINNILYIVSGSSLIVCQPTGGNTNLAQAVFTTVGTLNTATGPVSIECNTVQLAISDGQFGYTYTLSSGSFAVITGGGWPGSVTNFTYYDGYILGAQTASKTVWQSNQLDATTWGSQAFDTTTSFPDNINAVFSDELQLYIFGPKITEVQADAGSIPYAFQKVANVLIQAGCVAWPTIKKMANTFFFLASDIAGKAYIAALNSYDTKVISTPPINEAIQRYTKISDAYSWAYREGDNHFYCITFPSAGATWCYDIKMDMWHKRSINEGADLPTACILWQGMQVVGDAQGSLYIMSQDYATYSIYNVNTASFSDIPLSRTRTAAHVNADGKTMFINELWVDMQVGYGFVPNANLAVQPLDGIYLPAVLQQATGLEVSPFSITLNPTRAGSLIAVFIILRNLGGGASVTSVTDNLGQTYLQVPNAVSLDSSGQNLSDVWYFPNTQAGVTTVTVTAVIPEGQTGAGYVFEVTNIQDAPAVLTSNTINNASTSSLATAAALSINQPAFVLAGINDQGIGSSSVNTPYILDDLVGYCAYFSLSQKNSNGGFSTAAVFNVGSSVTYCSSTVAFKGIVSVSPLATLYVSKDFGNTWQSVGTRSLGAVGKLQQRLVWRNLGRFRQNATFKLIVTDPVGVYIIGAKASIKTGLK